MHVPGSRARRNQPLPFFVISFALLIASTSIHAQTPAPIASYSFDQGTGTTVADDSGNGNTLTLVNGPSWTPGWYGGSLTFDGSNDRAVAASYKAALALTGSRFTISTWIYPRSNSTMQAVVAKPHNSAHNAPFFDWAMLRDRSGRIVVFLGCEVMHRPSNASTPLNVWTHVAVSYDGSTLRHYVNGALDRSTPVDCRITNTNSRPIRIGANGANGEVLNGRLDDLRIYDRALSQSELQVAMNTPLEGGSTPPPADTTPPAVAISAPAANSTVNGTIAVTAQASDNVGVSGVQFTLDGVNLGAQDTAAPYEVSWNTTTAGNGAHVLAAIARDAAGNQRTSNGVSVTVSNNTAPPPTLAVSLSASPSGGVAPVNDADFTASVSGTATGSITYTYYCNRSDSGTNVTSPFARQVSTSATPHTAADVCDYAASGTYSAKVIVQRDGLLAEARATISVSAPTTPPPAVSVDLSASPTSVASGGSSSLVWSSANATSCTAGGAWSGARPTAGSASTGPLTAQSNVFSLTCTDGTSTASDSATVTVQGGATQSGLDFRGNASSEETVRFRFTNPLAIYPATYIWRLKPRRQAGYYTTFFWGNDGPFTWSPYADSYYGAHPYPDPAPSGTSHRWEIAGNFGGDYVSQEFVTYDVWHTQALRVWSDSQGKHHEFYWDLPNTSRVIRMTAPSSFGNATPDRPALTFGDAPWNPSEEILNGVLRGIQIYSVSLSLNDIQAEINAPLSTAGGASNIWYMNLDPKPTDISDKSGAGNNPQWVGSERPLLWTGP